MNNHHRARHLLVAALASTLLAAGPAAAANLTISNPRWIPAADGAKNAAVLCDIQWDNSWRASWRDGSRSVTNWDAVWIFVKLRGPDGLWRHAPLAPGSHQAPPTAAVQVPADRAGAFLYGTKEYRGAMKLNDVRLAVESSNADVKPEDFRIFGVEMVLIPEVPFRLGYGLPASCMFYKYPPPEKPFLVESEAAIPLGDRDGALAFHPSHYNPETNGVLPAAFPKGYRAFYCMKYGLRWGDYAQFLNTLTLQQATNCFPIGDEGFSGPIMGTHPQLKAAAPGDYCSNLRWPDGTAIADWQGLRPMTEMEYEKAFRGSFTKIKVDISEGLEEDLFAAEETADAKMLDRKTDHGYWVDFEWGPFPQGVTDKLPPNTMYYGVIANHLCDQCVTVGHEKGWAFRGTHGDGNLSPAGFADVPDWPEADGLGSGYRGRYGGYSSPSLRVNNRTLAACGHGSRGHGEKSWRSVRSAP